MKWIIACRKASVLIYVIRESLPARLLSAISTFEKTVFKYCFEDDMYMSIIIENLTYQTAGKSVFAAGKYCCRKIIISTENYVPWTHLLSLPLWMIFYRQQCIEKLEITYRFNMRIQYHSITSWN